MFYTRLVPYFDQRLNHIASQNGMISDIYSRGVLFSTQGQIFISALSPSYLIVIWPYTCFFFLAGRTFYPEILHMRCNNVACPLPCPYFTVKFSYM